MLLILNSLINMKCEIEIYGLIIEILEIDFYN